VTEEVACSMTDAEATMVMKMADKRITGMNIQTIQEQNLVVREPIGQSRDYNRLAP
jgi:hypothetical protein